MDQLVNAFWIVDMVIGTLVVFLVVFTNIELHHKEKNAKN